MTTHHMSEAEQCDRVMVLMSGRVVVSGTMASLLDGEETVVVAADDWSDAFARLDTVFSAVALAGRAIRVPDATVAAVRAALGDTPAEVCVAPASFDEVFVTLGRST